MGKIHLTFFKLLTLTYQIEMQIIKEFRLTLVEHYTLQILNSLVQVTPHELVDKFSLSKSSITYVLDSLEEKGLIGRERNKDDRRSYFVYLTKKGKKTVRKILLGREAAIVMSALNTLPDKEKTYWNRFLESVIARFEDYLMEKNKRYV